MIFLKGSVPNNLQATSCVALNGPSVASIDKSLLSDTAEQVELCQFPAKSNPRGNSDDTVHKQGHLLLQILPDSQIETK